ncbi:MULTISPECIES: NEL-type E3 ubiquitin ligase domain-containing protein [unclassified Pseudomonas]|uniref:NEL-type E3 ubiquitin ligase domain-containing protein n=1 Tax=unclassified Pseudomonas TaxID=196821 RepID=UPI0009EB8FFB|nr:MULTISPECIES: NEL-type E3 ubiquitin ligase domain-containing protein [unclassified Pseudomonas]RAH01485.1 hypothetical protein DJ480_17895 [Pseudomonas sp. Leaf98]
MADPTLPSSPAVPISDTTEHLKPEATQSLHGDFLEQASPRWLIDAPPARKQALKDAGTQMPAWLQQATPVQRKAVASHFLESFTAQTQLDKSMSTFQDLDDFARPLLLKALKDQYQLEVDVDTTLLCLRRALAVGIAEVEVADFEVLKLSMLDAALHNFEAYECEEGAYHKTSGFVVATSTPGTYHSVTVNLKVSQFLGLCRSLDIGAKYQAYLQAFFYPQDATVQATLRDHFIANQKAALRAAAEQALLTGDIEAADHRMLLSVINGEIHPWMGEQQVWFRTLGLMRLRMTGCMVFLICKKYSYPDELIIYIPQDPEHPLKRYRWREMEAEFKRLFTAREPGKAKDPSPTPYQKFFSRFVPFEKRAFYFSQFTRKAADSPTDIWRSPWRRIVEFTTPHFITGIKELPPEKPANLEPNDEPFLEPSTRQRRGKGIWAANIDPWQYFYEQHREQLFADARAHAVPTADVDTKARDAKLAHLLEVGLLGLNLASMFVPVLGEAMMVVMAGQLLYETLEGAIEWGEGDRQAAKAHLIDVAENLAQIALMAAVGAAVGRWQAAPATPVIEALSPVTRADGQVRLWRPGLGGYEAPVTLGQDLHPNALGQYVKDGKTYIREGTQVYEQYFDESIRQWRIRHPTDAEAYQPILQHNGHGAWQHTLERPLSWDRLTLLRRMGHETQGFTDQELLKIADVSGVSDNTLRKMHADHTPVPPELADAMRLFKADAHAARVIEQLEGKKPIDDLYLYALPLIVEMPGWPRGRVLEVFEGAGYVGPSVKYGASGVLKGAKTQPVIQLGRADMLGGEVPARILQSLDESETDQLLGTHAGWDNAARKAAFNQQLVDYARQRRPAIFDSLYGGTEAVGIRVRRLQRTCPGLSEAAARTVLDHAAANELERFDATLRVPLNMLEEARWYARQGRLARAYAGLRSEVIAPADSRRLALHTLQTLPGWPDTLRLEVRSTNTRGTLLDSIGAEDAAQKKYLVKQGPSYQAFDEREEALNSLAADGDNFFASLMHALPDEARQSLGVPHVSQHAALQRKLIEQADTQRMAASGWLEPDTPWLKPPVRVGDTLVGYYASGRAPSVSPTLAHQIRRIYPDLKPEQISAFMLEQVRAGKNARAIVEHLKALMTERTELHATIDHWVHHSPALQRQGNFVAGETLKRSWRRACLVGHEADADVLALNLTDPLPPLTANFAYVRELTVNGTALHDGNVDVFLAQFPKVERLTLQVPYSPAVESAGGLRLTNVPVTLEQLQGLKHLSMHFGAHRLSAQLPSRLAALTRLERLEVSYYGYQSEVLASLDLARLQRLQRLKIIAPIVTLSWPAYAQKLALLERLDLSRTTIDALPDELYTGHERLWSGLSLDWSTFSYEAFKPAYEHVKHYAGPFGPHLANLDEMVRGFARGELGLLMGERNIAYRMTDAVMGLWNSPHTRMNAIEALRAEHSGIFGQFYRPSRLPGFKNRFRVERWRTGYNAVILQALEDSWSGAVSRRYGLAVDRDVALLQLPDLTAPSAAALMLEKIRELPVLPAGTFAHVKTLKVKWLEGVPATQVGGFLQAFSGVQTLELRLSQLTEVPVAASTMPALTHLDLSDNHIVVTPAVQAQFNGLTNLQVLILQNNRLGSLDVSALSQLTALNLRETLLQAWPAGAENLAQLHSLDLRDNQLIRLAPGALNHPDVLMRTELAGNPLSVDGQAALSAARQRIEQVKGLPEGALSRFALGQEPWMFPPEQTADSIAAHLLPLLQSADGLEGAAGFAERIQRLSPTMTDEQAWERVTSLRDATLEDAEIDAQISHWYQVHEALTRTLNGWLFRRPMGFSDRLLTLEDRKVAAMRIRNAWAEYTARGYSLDQGEELDLQGLQTGDLPALAVPFPHVRRLNLTGVKLTAEGSNSFLTAFPQLRHLILSGNPLTALPEAVQHMSELEKLVLASNAFTHMPALPVQLSERLLWLDLSHNSLQVFDARAFSRLQTLDLSYNSLSSWPEGVLGSESLSRLNLSGNALESLPPTLLSGEYDALVSATDVSDNRNLTAQTLEQMRNYARAQGVDEVMGVSRAELDRAHRRHHEGPDTDSDAGSDAGAHSDSDSDGNDSDPDAAYSPPESLENPQLHVAPLALEPWLANTAAALSTQRTALWNQLAQAQNHERFFHLISQLRLTSEFDLNRASLTQRVWDVVAGAAENAELRGTLFVEAETHGTCIDGRILTFSEMEVRVFEYRALRDIPQQRLDLRGRALLDLSRQLFRLSNVDQRAEAAAVGLDRAEVRLSYRIGLTRGWPDGLELPGQPSYMAFANPISAEVQARVRTQMLAAERTDDFVESLIQREYWLRYLETRYPEQFDALERELASRHEALEDEHSDRADAQSTARYDDAIGQLEVERGAARTQKRMELSRTEIQRLTGTEPAEPAPSSPQPGPSWRP